MRTGFFLLLALAFAPPPAFSQAGTLDPSFDVDGIAVGPLALSDASSVAIDRYGRFVVSGAAFVGAGRNGALVSRFFEDGRIDSSFADNGVLLTQQDGRSIYGGPIVEVDHGYYFTAVHRIYDRAAYMQLISPDGDLVATCPSGINGVDVRFVGGMAPTEDGGVVVAFRNFYYPYSETQVLKVAIDYAGGTCRPDPQFGIGGNARLRLPGYKAAVVDAAVQQDGRIVVAGWVREENEEFGPSYPFAARLTSSGAFDPAFGYGGAGFTVYRRAGLDQPEATTVTLGTDGAIVLAGPSHRTSGRGWLVVRLRYDGIPDDAFGENGSVYLPLASSNVNYDVGAGVDEQGRITLAGSVNDAQGTTWVVARLRKLDGALDPDFGTGGISAIRPLGGNGTLGALALQPDGRAVVVGSAPQQDGPHVAIARLLADEAATATEQAPSAERVLRVWPNPARGAATLLITLPGAGPVVADLYDVLGRHVVRVAETVRSAGVQEVPLELEGVPPGLYVLRVETVEGVRTGRLAVR